MPHRQSDILLCYFALDASDATDILWLVVCTGVRFSVGCISGTHCFSFSMCALYKYEIQIVNSFMYTGFLLLLGDGGGTREKITINSRSCAFCAVWHQLTTLFCTPDVSQANHDLYSGEIFPRFKWFQNLCLQRRHVNKSFSVVQQWVHSSSWLLCRWWLLMASLLRSLDRSSSHLQSSYCTSWYFCMILSSLSRWYERTYIWVFASQVHPYLNRGRNDFQHLALVTQFLACVPGMI